MQAYNQDSYGEKIRCRFTSDVSTANSYQLTFEPQNGADFTKSATLGASDVYEGDQFFEANKYIEYTTEDDIFDDYAGRWRVKGEAFFTSSTLSSEYKTFRVTE